VFRDDPRAARGRSGFTVVNFREHEDQRKVKDLFQHRPPTEEELAARAEVESERDQIRQEVGQKSQVDHIPPF
jgi:hypothetical protein